MDETWLWAIFGIVFVAAISFDLFIFQRKAHVVPIKEALKLVAFWVGLALAFAILVYFTLGYTKASEFVTAYLLEYSLSIDNLFVFLSLFAYFAVPEEARRKVLLWGILGAVFFRGVFIFAGTALIGRFHFLLYVLGAVLLYTAVRLILDKDKKVAPEKNPVVRLTRKFVPVVPEYEDNRFFSRRNGRVYATPLIVALISIETMDIMFAIDSVPAVFGITLDPFIVYTSNIFAILGLRALFFALSGLFGLFRFLVYGLCAVLIFIAVKMFIGDFVEIPTFVSLAVICAVIIGSVLASVLLPDKKKAT